MALTDKTELTVRVGDVTRLNRLAQNDDDNITEAAAVATQMFRESALIRFTEASVDALTTATISKHAKFHIESIALYVLTSNGGVSPETYKADYEHALEWLKLLRSGKVTMEGLELLSTSVSGASGSGRVAYGSRTRVFDSDNDEYVARKPTL